MSAQSLSSRAPRPPLVSVLMPTWNRLPFIEEAISSVLAQTEPRLELIVIDDGSTDGTYERLETISDPRFRLLRREHRGISAALNAGLAEASGQWVARLDSDDYWFPEFLEQQLALAVMNPDAVAVYSRGEAADASLQPSGIRRGTPPRRPDDALGSLLLGDFTCNITVIARRRDIVDAGGWREDLPHGEDWDLWLRLARRGPFVWNPDVLALFREHDSNTTRLRWDEIPDVRVSILRSHLDDPELPEAARALGPVARRRLHVKCAMDRLVRGKKRQALADLRIAWRDGDGLLPTAGFAAVQFLVWFVIPRFSWLQRLHGRLLAWRDRRRQRHSP